MCDTTGKKMTNVALVIVIVLVWGLINNYLCEQVDSLDTTLSFAQLANLIGALGIAWPDRIQGVFNVASVLDFDVRTNTRVHTYTQAHEHTNREV